MKNEQTFFNFENVNTDDFFTEFSVYKFKEVINSNECKYEVFKNGVEHTGQINVSNDFVRNNWNHLQYDETVKVGKKDKLWTQNQIEKELSKGNIVEEDNIRAGDIKLAGMETIFTEVGKNPFIIKYNKKAKKKQVKVLKEELKTQREQLINRVLEVVKDFNLGITTEEMLEKLTPELEKIQKNPISEYIQEERTLYGILLSAKSLNGVYSVVDLKILNETKDINKSIRQVTLDNVTELIIGGKRHIKE